MHTHTSLVPRARRVSSAALLACSLAGASASASVLVHDGFATGSYTLGASPVGVNGGTGFGSAWSFQTTGNGASAQVVAGLTLAGFESSGNALRISANPSGGAVTGALRRNFGQATTANGNLWGSFLLRQDSWTLPNGFDGTFVSSGTRFQPGADREFFSSAIFGGSFTNNLQMQVGVFRNPSGSVVHNPSPTLGTTYLVVTGFENINFGAFTGNQTTVNMWLLDAADVAAIGNSVSVAALNANSRAKINVAPFTSTFGVNGVGAATPFDLFAQQGTATFDEIRWGTTLASVYVTAIPEPSGVAALAGAGALLLVATRRRRR